MKIHIKVILILVIYSLFFVFENVYATSMPLAPTDFDINNQTSDPFTLTIPSQGSSVANFNLYWDWYHGGSSAFDMPGNYLQFSVLSDKKIDIYRTNNPGVYCGANCFSNQVYLQLVSEDENSYTYMFYFMVSKWQVDIGTQYDSYYVTDRYTFKNLESGTANVYVYGVYANDNNPIPNLISDEKIYENIIIGNESFTQEIIDNQNQNAQDIIDNLNSDCSNLLNTSLEIIKATNNLGTWNNNVYTYNGVTYTVNDDLSITIGGTYSTRSYFYLHNYKTYSYGEYFLAGSKNGTIVADVRRDNSYFTSFNDNGNGISINLPSGHTYLLDFYININSSDKIGQTIYPQLVLGNKALNYCTYGSKVNKIDDTTQAIQDTNESINDLNENITSNNIDSPNSDFSEMEDMIAENGVITNLITLPITLYQAILNSVNGTCTSYSFGQLFGNEISFSCISLQTLLGSTLYGVIDILFSGFTILAIARKMIKVFNNFSSLNEGDVIDD